MIPILYGADTTAWADNGLGFLRDAVACRVAEERNGPYELELQYPIAGAHYADIQEDCLVKVKAGNAGALQMFRLYKASKPINGVVTFYGRHLSYDLNGLIVPGVTVRGMNATAAMAMALANTVTPHSFEAWSDVDAVSSTSFTRPCGVRGILGGQQGSILQNWGGEYEFDNHTVRLWRKRGRDTEVVIEYGKNLVDARQEKNLENPGGARGVEQLDFQGRHGRQPSHLRKGGHINGGNYLRRDHPDRERDVERLGKRKLKALPD